MKKLIYISLLFILNSSFLIHNCLCQWVQMSNGMGNDKIVMCMKTYGNNIFAGTWGDGIFLSTNNGQSWTQTALDSQYIYSIAIYGNIIFTGMYNYPAGSGGVYFSTNNGQNWTQTTLINKSVHSLAISGNNIFAGCSNNQGVWLSTNSGQNWTQTTLNNRTVFSLSISGNNIFAGTSVYGIYLSTNNGQTWIQKSLNNVTVSAIAISGNNIFAGIYTYGIFFSPDNGENWYQTTFNFRTVHSIVIFENKIFAGSLDTGVWLSTNNGQNWIQKNQGFIGFPTIFELFVSNIYIFAGTDGQSLWRCPLSDFIGIKNISTEIPSAYSLGQNYPNPFNQSTMFKFQCSMSGIVKISVYDITGKEVATLVNEKLNPGTYEVKFDAGNLPSGIYFYRMQIADPLRRTEKFSSTKKLIILK